MIHALVAAFAPVAPIAGIASADSALTFQLASALAKFAGNCFLTQEARQDAAF